MFKYFIAISTFSVASLAFASGQLLPSSDAEIKFVAESQKTVENDLATIVVSAQVRSKELKDAQSQVNSLMSQAEKELKKFSPTTKFSTVNYSVRPIYDDLSSANSEIANWEAVQRIRLTTKDLEIVPSLVQVAQNKGLGLSSINYSVTNETLDKVNEQLVGDVIKNINKKASDIAQAMELPIGDYSIEKIDFDESDRPIGPALLSARSARGISDNVELPVFEPGTTEIHKVAQVTLKVSAKQKSDTHRK